MNKQESIGFKIARVLLALNGVAILGFGLIVAALPGSTAALYMRADGVASIGMGLFGIMIAAIPFRRRARWAWLTLWYYPLFWIAHLLGGLPPGQDHIHQILFIILSLAGLLLPIHEFFPSGEARQA